MVRLDKVLCSEAINHLLSCISVLVSVTFRLTAFLTDLGPPDTLHLLCCHVDFYVCLHSTSPSWVRSQGG